MNPKRVLFVGNLLDIKGVDHLLSAWQTLISKYELSFEIELIIIGDGPQWEKLQKQAQEFGISNSVKFLGTKPHSEIADWMRSSDCLCLPSHSEGMPNVVLEALACGIPVVATNVGEIPFLIKNNINGFIVKQSQTLVTSNDQKWKLREKKAELMKRKNEGTGFSYRLAENLIKTLKRNWDAKMISELVNDYTWEKAAIIIVDTIQQKTKIT